MDITDLLRDYLTLIGSIGPIIILIYAVYKVGKRVSENLKRDKKGSGVHSSVFRISISHPRFLSKRFASPFFVHIYSPNVRSQVTASLESGFDDQESVEHVYDSSLVVESTVTMK